MGKSTFVVVAAVVLAGACIEPEPVAIDEQFAIACADGPTIRGMDVSYYEDSVDWNAAHRAGIDFAFIRVTDGRTYLDPRFAEYWAGARAAGVIRGAYQFFRPAEDPIAQADLLLDKMGPLEPGDLPPVIDVEVSGGLSQAQVAAAVQIWVTHVAQRIGRAPIIYAGLYSWHDLTNSADLTASPLWVAQYTSAACPNIPAPWERWMFWQNSSTGSVSGVPGAMLDVNLFNGTLDDLRAFTTPGVCGDGTCSGGETTDSCAVDCPPCGVIGDGGGVIDDGDACFVDGGPPQYLRQVGDAGDGGDLIWTYATASAQEVSFGQWNLYVATAGRYRVEAYTAGDYAASTRAAYVVSAGGVATTVTIDQTAVNGWQSLGDREFAAGGGQSIHLGDNTGEPSAGDVRLVFDAVRLTRLDGDGGPDPLPPSGGGADPSPPGAPPPDGGASDPGLDAGAGCATTGSNGALVALASLILLAARRRRRA